MNLEAHPVLHMIFFFFCYLLGQAAGVLGAAYAASKSTLNSITSIRQWFSLRWVPVTLRAVMALFLFCMVWENPLLPIGASLEKFMSGFLAHMGAAGFLGFASDQLCDKVLIMLFPSVQKELPAVPPVAGDKS